MEKPSIHQRINLKAMLNSFLNIMVERFQDSIDEQGIGQTDAAYRSFKKALFYSGGNISNVKVSFYKYLRFVDMGVGKGMPIGKRRDLGDSIYLKKRERNGRLKNLKRKAKPWYGKTKASQIMRLREIMIRDYSINVIKELEKDLTQNIKINI
jgi:hypothetical protein